MAGLNGGDLRPPGQILPHVRRKMGTFAIAAN